MTDAEKLQQVLAILAKHGIGPNAIRTHMMFSLADDAKSKDVPKADRARFEVCAKELNSLGFEWLDR